MQRDLRHFLTQLRIAGKLLELNREVDPKFEFSLVRKAAENLGKGLLFKNIKGFPFPVITIYSDRERC